MTPDQYENAARAVHAALQARTTGRRLHIDRFKKHAAAALGMRAVYPARWAEVIDAGRRLGLFKVDRKTLKKPFFVDLKPHTTPEHTFDEDTSDDPTVEHAGQIASPPVKMVHRRPPAKVPNRMIVLVRYPKGHHRHEPSGGGWQTVGKPVTITDVHRAVCESFADAKRRRGAEATIAYFAT